MPLPFQPDVIGGNHHNPVEEIDLPPEEIAEASKSGRKKAWRRRLLRREKIQRIAYAAVERRQRMLEWPAAAVRRSLPRPRRLEGPGEDSWEPSGLPSPRRAVVFNAGIARTVARLFVWLYWGFRFALGVFWDWLHRRNTQEHQARRLRETLQKMGTTFIKIGQQLSMRLDFLPYAYTRELGDLRDKVPPFPSDEAIRTIERATGRRLEQVFEAFDVEPIGSASVACVYQAVLKSGERVAVKVRRPGIGPRLAADMRALGWLLNLAENVFFVSGFTANFIEELRTMLMEELDFVREARFTDLFRRRMRKVKELSFATAPRVFFDYSSAEVMVTELVSGIWLDQILKALEVQNPRLLAELEEMNFDRVILARRIQLLARFNNFEHIFFHADLHPANILIQPGNKIVLIDFGSCGSFSRRELNSWRRLFDAQSVDDVGGMVQAAMGIIEPLPPIDRFQFGLRLEYLFSNHLYAIKSKHADWSERISARIWIDFLDLSREFQIPMRLNLLRMIRASMLTDTIAVRLDEDQDLYREFRYYEKGAGQRAKKQVKKRLHRLCGPSKFIRIQQGVESAVNLVYQVEHALDSLALIRIGDIIRRVEYFLTLELKHLVWILMTAMVGTLCVLVNKWRTSPPTHLFNPLYLSNLLSDLSDAWWTVLKSHQWQFIALVPGMICLWRIHFRLSKERNRWN